MKNSKAFERDPYLRELEVRVVEIGQEGKRYWVTLDDTILYPEGGGQPGDHGVLGRIPVTEVQKREGEIRHFLDHPIIIGPTRLTIDWTRRFDHMQQHTAQHLLTALAQDRFGWPTTAFHLGEQLSDIELATEKIASSQLEELEEVVAEAIRGGLPVSVRRVQPDTLDELKVRTRGLPPGHSGDVRLVEIAGIDLNTCGGTHVRSTAELEAVKLLFTEPMRGGTRLFFVAGGRLRRRFATHEKRNAELRSILGASDGELTSIAALKIDMLHTTERRLRAAEEELALALADTLATSREHLVHKHLENKDANFLLRLAHQLTPIAPEKLAFLTSQMGEQALFVLAAGDSVAIDVQAACREVCSLLGAKGGGTGRFAQGKASSLSSTAMVLARLATLVKGT